MKGFLCVGFGRLITAKFGNNAPGRDIEERRGGSVVRLIKWQTQTNHP